MKKWNGAPKHNAYKFKNDFKFTYTKFDDSVYNAEKSDNNNSSYKDVLNLFFKNDDEKEEDQKKKKNQNNDLIGKEKS